MKSMVLQEPEATILFDTSRRSCGNLEEKDSELKFSLQSFIRENRSVNGLVTQQTVASLYDMILDYARTYVNERPTTHRMYRKRVDALYAVRYIIGRQIVLIELKEKEKVKVSLQMRHMFPNRIKVRVKENQSRVPRVKARQDQRSQINRLLLQ